MGTIYSSDTLKSIQRSMTFVLREFDRICTALDLRYVVYGGTAIGAVRHGGFIPWDDDIDICMPREDYDRFFREAPALLGKEFVLIDSRTDPQYPKTFGVLGLVGSEFIPGLAAKRDYKMPLGIDLFPLDPIPCDKRQFARQARASWVLGRLLYLKGTPKALVDLPGPAKIIVCSAMHTIHWALKLSRIRYSTLIRAWEKVARRHEGSSSTLLGDFNTRDPRRWSASLDELFPAQRVPFDNITVMLPRDYDTILTRGYGDYMQLPPESERVNHEAVSVCFGPTSCD